MIGTVKSFSIMAILLTSIFSIILTSCQQRTDNVSDNVVSKPSTPYVAVLPTPSKPNHNLDTAISELVSAYESGGNAAATAYAKQYSIDIVNGMACVVIEVKPGSKTAALDAVNKSGAKFVSINANADFIGACIPFNQIKTLASNSAIKLIRQPVRGSIP